MYKHGYYADCLSSAVEHGQLSFTWHGMGDSLPHCTKYPFSGLEWFQIWGKKKRIVPNLELGKFSHAVQAKDN